MPIMTQALKPFLDKFVIVCFDDIQIFNQSLQDHIGHVERVLKILRAK